ncbi:PREDICTED: trans-Golgi network integral membrane protein 1-like [Vollenhovia emeryi]|uniref:trans-Golgi network integral membrane protein 1-like n=1 Tax=Vollenhovia emeryi TaxID=411798 RepID=UPI0005F42520|nr:PREDICTED: trans-Golgi network integral membrane protein 1-like [Vollenhovia emeryi]
MENRHIDLFRVIFMLNCFVPFLSFTGVTSAPVIPPSIIDIMKNDSKLCQTSKFLYDSEYARPCASMAYPIASWNYDPETLSNFLCLGVYDTAYKICQYSSRLQIPLNSTATLNSYVEKYVPNKTKTQEDFCNSLQGFTSLYSKIDFFLAQLVESLNTPHTCVKICFDLRDKFHPLCAVLAWIKSIDDMMKSVKVETTHDLVPTDKPPMNQLKDGVTGDIKTTQVESKTIEVKEPKESKEQNRKQITIDSNNSNNVKEGNSNVPDNAPFDEEKTKFDTEKANNIQKKINNNTLETQVHKLIPSIFNENKENSGTELGTNVDVAKPIKNMPPNSDSQAPSINKAINNAKKVVNEENAEKSNKLQEIDDLKPSTLSENTQDHYDAENPEVNMENDIDDVGDTIQHPDTGSHNDNVQETYERKNNNARLTEYSNMRTEDDSHFFTYFTVITLACLAGYIGYHNKQKILAIVLEGRRSRNSRGRRRPSTASYRKLDCTLEEAVTSQCNANVTHVIY